MEIRGDNEGKGMIGSWRTIIWENFYQFLITNNTEKDFEKFTRKQLEKLEKIQNFMKNEIYINAIFCYVP